jgi:cation diffusion facilitator CzcD-associated flavoprotein CzcO
MPERARPEHARPEHSRPEHHRPEHHRAVIVGAGFAGIGASVALAGRGTEHVIFERAGELGGTWRDNQYPGCRCDVPSHLYSFSFALNPEWSETYSPQPEIQAYLQRTAAAYRVTERIHFNRDVLGADWDPAGQRWRLATSAGPCTTDVLLLANGPLAEPALPDLPGADRFEGPAFHSARWRRDLDLAGRRVAVIGTGASAIQIVPAIQPLVARLTVFQRTAPWVLPHSNRRITDTERAIYRRVPAAQRLVRQGIYWSREAVAAPLLRSGPLLSRFERLARRHIASQVHDAELRAKVMPDYRPGCKRLLPSDDWYPAIQQPNVELLADKIVEVGPDRIFTADGREVPVDTIVFATGFRVTDNPVAERIRGATGRTLAERWSATGMQAYLGTTVPDFPNLFLLAGPNTGIGHTSLVFMIEAQLAYVMGALDDMARRGASSIELRQGVLDQWTHEIQAKAAGTVWNTGGCASWYLDAEGRNTTIWPDYTFRYRRLTRHFDATCYRFATESEP